MTTTATRLVTSIITQAMRKAAITAVDETADPATAAHAMIELNSMLKAWQTVPYTVFTKASGSLTLTTAGSYTLSPARPLRILSARYKDTTELPMNELTRDEYDSLPLKTTTGIPTNFYYDRQKEAALFYIWPLMASVTSETIEYTYEREAEDISSLNDTIDLPSEWWEAAVYGLASRLIDTIPAHPNPNLIHARAKEYLDLARAMDTEGSVFF